MICDHPCESACVREVAGGAIRISELEKAAVKAWIQTLPKKALSIPKKAGKAAVDWRGFKRDCGCLGT